VAAQSTAPATIALVLSRRTRHQAAAAAVRDPRLDTVERILAAFRIAADVLVLVLSAVAWVWIAAHRSAAGSAGAAGVPTDRPIAAPGLAAVLRPLSGLSGTGLVLVALPTCLLMAASVNPFYSPPADHRARHTTRTAVFGVLVVSTVALFAAAAR
jgi:hypothetical protein